MKRRTPRVLSRAAVEMLETRRLLTLAAPVSYPAVANVIATCDLNGDGRSDVISASTVNSFVRVCLSNANGTLQAAQNTPVGSGPQGIAVGDVNGDGKRDVITANGGGNVSILIGNGDGTLLPAQHAGLPPQFPPGYTGVDALGQAASSVAVGDLNADGKLDLVVGAQTAFNTSYISYYGSTITFTTTHGYVNVLIGNGSGSFAPATAYSQNYIAPTVALADFNGDNRLDVMTTDSQVGVRLGNGDGTLKALVTSNSYGSAVTGDFDNDGKVDVATGVAGGLSFVKGKGTGAFEDPITLNQDDVRSLVAGDVNADGKLDLLVSTKKTTFEYYGYYGGYNPTTVDYTKVLLGYGDGTFALPHTTTLGSHADYGVTNKSTIGDFNGDARPDLLAIDPFNSTLYVQLNQNDWVLPGTLSIGDATVTEGHSGTANAVFTVTLAAAPASNVSVNYSTADSSATVAGDDYLVTSGALTFTPGQTTKTIIVPLKGDRVGEIDELFYVNLTNAVNADIVDGQGVGTIVDDEPRVSINSASATEGNSGTTLMNFTVTLSAASAATSTVSFVTAGGTAISGQDYNATDDTLTFTAGQTSKTVTVAVRGDVIDEYDETFTVALSNAANGFIVNGSGTGTIVDNDAAPAMVISNVSRAEGNSGTTPFTFTISLLTPSEKYVNVAYATANGTATSSTNGNKQDYHVASYYALSFYPSQQSATVTVEVVGDTRSESDETFFVNLSNPSDATIADSQGVGTILNDEGGRGKTWVGPASGGSWATAGNWSPSGVPIATSLVKIGVGASVTLSSAATVSELTLKDGATLSVATNGSRVLRTGGLFFDGTSTLNLNDNDLIVDYTAGSSPLGLWNGGIYAHYYEGINGLVEHGSNGGAWDGLGIVTTRPDALAGLTTFAVAEASQARGLTGSQTALFSGQTVDATTVLVKYTYVGDANMDGVISGDDYSAIDFNIALPGSRGWCNGDFNYDGVISGDDYSAIDFNIAAQGSPH